MAIFKKISVMLVTILFILALSMSYNADVFAKSKIATSTYNNVYELKGKNLNAGTVVRTKGYYKAYDGGGAKYIIQDSKQFGGIELQSGKYANIVIENQKVNVKALGAVGDGITDDSDAINKALNSGYTTIVFPNAEYACNSHIRMRTSNTSIVGNNSVLVTNDNFSSDYYEWFFSVQADNISIDNLKMECRETHTHGFKTQFGAFYSNDLTITNCEFNIPHSVIEINPYQEIEYTNLDIYTGCHGVLIDNCSFVNEADAYAGMCCEIRDLLAAGSSDIRVTNNKFYHKGQDEILAIFSNSNDHSGFNTMSDVVIENNDFIQSSGNYSRNASMTLGAGKDRGVNHISFIGNYVELNAKCIFFITGSSIDANIINNTIVLSVDDHAEYLSMIYSAQDAPPVNVIGNTIDIQSDKAYSSYHFEICNKDLNFESNTIDY